MTALALLHDLEKMGVAIDREGDRLVVVGPDDALTDPLLERLRSAKPEILKALMAIQERIPTKAEVEPSGTSAGFKDAHSQQNLDGKWHDSPDLVAIPGEGLVTPSKHLHTCIRSANRNAEEWRAYFHDRAGILEHDHGLSRQAAERRTFDFTVVEWLNQHPHPSDPGHCAWCAATETSDARIVPYGANQSRHVWLHPACWLPWHDERRRSARSALAAFGIGEPRKASQ